MRGTYSFVYSSIGGVGAGIFYVSDDGSLVGCDFGGGEYRGKVVENTITRELEVTFNMFVPAGLILVTGVAPQGLAYSKKSIVKMPPNYGDGRPVEMYIAPADITVMVKRIPDEYSAYAKGFKVNITLNPSSKAA